MHKITIKKTYSSKSLSKDWGKWLDKLWGLLIHSKFKGCVWCGKEYGKLDAHHIFPRGGRKSTRWHPLNGVLLCYYCHRYRINSDSEGFRELAISILGEDKYRVLYYLSKMPQKYFDYQAIELSLIIELEKLKVDVPQRPKKLWGYI